MCIASIFTKDIEKMSSIPYICVSVVVVGSAVVMGSLLNTDTQKCPEYEYGHPVDCVNCDIHDK